LSICSTQRMCPAEVELKLFRMVIEDSGGE
jgi:hypothetical protein